MNKVPIHIWAKQHNINEMQARWYAKLGRIPGADIEFWQIDVPLNSTLLPTSTNDVPLPPFELTEGQKRVREIIKGYRVKYQELKFGSNLKDFSEAIQIKCELEKDLVIKNDQITGINLNHRKYNRRYLEYLESNKPHKHFDNIILDVHLWDFVDVASRRDRKLLGEKPYATISSLLKLDSQERLEGVFVTLFNNSSLVMIGSDGAHRSLATLLFGASILNASRVTIVYTEIDTRVNEVMNFLENILSLDSFIELKDDSDINALLELYALLDILEQCKDFLLEFFKHKRRYIGPKDVRSELKSIYDYWNIINNKTMLRSMIKKIQSQDFYAKNILLLLILPKAKDEASKKYRKFLIEKDFTN